MSENRVPDMLVAFGVGLLTGAVAGVLLAPAAGEETRKRIGSLAQSTLDKTKETAGSASDFAKAQAKRVGQAFEEGKEAYLREAPKG